MLKQRGPVNPLKKIVAIFLLLVLLFNSIGFYGLVFILSHQLEQELTSDLESDEYSGDGTVLVKIPCPFPYQVSVDGYQRADGEFESDGETYTLVKQKRVGDTLYVVLIKAYGRVRVDNSVTSFFKNSQGAPFSRSVLKVSELFAKEYLKSEDGLQVLAAGWCSESMHGIAAAYFFSFCLQADSPPPRPTPTRADKA